MTGTTGRKGPAPQIVELFFGDSGPVQTRGPRVDCTGLGLNVGTPEVSDTFSNVFLQESGNGQSWQPLGPRRTCRFIRAVVQSEDQVPNLLVRITLS